MGVGAPSALFCVFDGHCGRRAAEQAAQVLVTTFIGTTAHGAYELY